MNDEILYQHLGLGRVRMLQQNRSVFDATYFHPPTNVYETNDSIVVTVEVAGLEDGGYEVSLSKADRLLTVSGRRHLPVADAKVTYHQLEIRQGGFVTQVHLSWNLSDSEEATAAYEDGFLVISLPKAKPKSVSVRIVSDQDG